MVRRPVLSLLLLLGATVPAGCGGSSHPAAGTAAAPSSSSTTVHATTASSSGTSGKPMTSQTGTSTAATSTGTQVHSSQPDINARVPASFQLRPGGHLDPPTVSAPAFVAVAFRIQSHDGRPHSVAIRLPRGLITLRIAPHGVVALRLPGQRAGTFSVLIDGVPRGSLSIGGEPGP
jgi:hypothetical protein